MLWGPEVEPAEVAGLASTRTFPLKSSFAPSYNMTINLVNQMGPEQARQLLERSFAQYQADRSVVGLVRGVERGEKMLDDIAGELGWDRRSNPAPEPAIVDYARLRAKISERERAQSRASRLQRRQAAGTRSPRCAAATSSISPRAAAAAWRWCWSRPPTPTIRGRWFSPKPLGGKDFHRRLSGAAGPVGSMTLPKRVEHRQPRVRRDLASALRSAAAGLVIPSGRKAARRPDAEPDIDPQLSALREEMRRHPRTGPPTATPRCASPNGICGSSATTTRSAPR